jgi:hypothetical protein
MKNKVNLFDKLRRALIDNNRETRLQIITEIQNKLREDLLKNGIDVNSIIPIIGSDIEWIQIVSHVFRVIKFDRSGTTIGPSNTVYASSPVEPYGYLLVESPILNQPAILPITHRDEFLLASSVFDDPQWLGIIEKEELLVTYVPKRMLSNGLAADTLLGLHFVITPRGTLDKYYKVGNDMHMANPAPKKLFGAFIWEGEVRVQINQHPIL